MCMVSLGCGKTTYECPYHVTGKGCRCKHITVVEYMLLKDTRPSLMGRLIIGEAGLKCHAKWPVCVGSGRFLGYDLGF